MIKINKDLATDRFLKIYLEQSVYADTDNNLLGPTPILRPHMYNNKTIIDK